MLGVFGLGVEVGRTLVNESAVGPVRTERARDRSVRHAGTPATRDAAVAAASAILYGFDLSTVLSPRRFDALIQRVAAPGGQGRIRTLFGRGIDDVRAMFADRPRMARTTPLGYRVLSFSGGRASVAIS